MSDDFDPQEAERIISWLRREGGYEQAAAMLRAAVAYHRRQRAEDYPGQLTQLEEQIDDLATRLAAAEKVVEAARSVVPWRNEHRIAKQLTFAEASSLTDLAQALQEYDRD